MFAMHLYIYRVSKKKLLAEPGAKLYLFCITLLYVVFSIFKKKFGIPMAQKKPRTFFVSKSKVQKAKMCVKIISIKV